MEEKEISPGEKSSFLSLVGRFLACRKYLGRINLRNPRFTGNDDGTVSLRYDCDCYCGDKGRRYTASISTGKNLKDCMDRVSSFMCHIFRTGSLEELDLFLTTRGF